MNATVLALNAMLLMGGCLVTTDRFRASTWWQEVRSSKATGVHYLGLIPPILLKAPESVEDRANLVRFGLGAGVDPAIHAAFEERFGFPLIECWGMTETSRLIANAHEPREVDTRAFGRPHGAWEVCIADEDGAPVEDGEAGAFLVRCRGTDPRAGFFSGYVNDPEATEKAWEGDWFHTGDVVRSDASGMLYFVERRKNIIRRSGENIAAAEIEEVIIVNPDVKGVAVVAVPDALRDEEPMACVILGPGAVPSQSVALAIFERARGGLAMHKLPGWIRFVDEIPVTPTQKVRKDLLLENFVAEPDSITFDLRPHKARKKAAQ
jgi:crotonobetaine/carnitine-CoA ligase